MTEKQKEIVKDYKKMLKNLQEQEANPDKFPILTVKDITRKNNVSKQYVYKLIKQHGLPLKQSN